MYQDQFRKTKINPIEKANILSRVTFFYLLHLFRKGNKKDITEDDIYEVIPRLKSKELGNKMEAIYKDNRCLKNKPSIYLLIWKCIGKEYILHITVQCFVNTVTVFFNPLLISKIVAYFTRDAGISKSEVIGLAIFFIVFNFWAIAYTHNYRFKITQLSIQLRTAISSIIYRKCLKITPLELDKFTNGRILTLLNKDVNYIENGLLEFGRGMCGIIQTFFITYVIYRRIGWFAFVGSGCFWIILVSQGVMGWNIFRKRTESANKMDQRMQITKECLSAIKLIKMYTWEAYFTKKISNARWNEISKLRQIYINAIVAFCVGDLSDKIAFFALSLVYSYLGNNVTPELMYFLIGTYVSIRPGISIYVPIAIQEVSEMISASKRIQQFLEAEELTYNSLNNKTMKEMPRVEINNLDFNINKRVIFNNISLDIKSGLHLLTGETGCGKTSLFKIILKEFQIEKNKLNINGKISYASQEPWLFPGSIKQNILFGEEYNKSRYNEVVDVCALQYDFNLFNYRDETIVGNRGINISKGQQARINLARAVYRNSDIYLIDDCLSCLDVQVQEEIFRKCIKKFLTDKLIILISCNKKYINYADNVICIKNCILTCNANISNNIEESYSKPHNYETELKNDEQQTIQVNEENDTSKLLQKNVHENSNIYKEINKEGEVEIKMFNNYLKFGGGITFLSVLTALFLTAQTALMYSDKLVSNWANLEQNSTSPNKTTLVVMKTERNYLIKMYIITFVTAVIIYIGRSIAVFIFTSNVSVNIHQLLIKNVISAKMDFFDSHLLGNILNRFSQDLAAVDDILSFAVFYVLRFIFLASSSLILIAYTNTILLIPIFILMIIIILARRLYIPIARPLKRLDNATRSPIIGHLNDTLEGITVIRAYEKLDIVTDEFDKHQDIFTSVHYSGQTLLEAFGMYLELFSIIFIAGILLITFLIVDSDVSAGNVGLAITQAFTFTGPLYWGICQWSELETRMTAVERITEYSDTKPENKSGLVLKNWPQLATIQFQRVSLKYNKTNDTVLKNLNFFINNKEKVGIVGRTGSGKSSIISSLFRLYDITGKIFIDGVDIQTISLDFLRTRIAIIPQDPIIFTGTLRNNIDPNNLYTDEQIWKALDILNLKNLFKDINQTIQDSAINFSSGQKQLICLARALVQKNKIIVLDEATANIDFNTDKLIQETFKNAFSNCTVLIIAHKLHSIMNCDRVMVLDKGKIVEFDSPEELMNESSTFYRMVQQCDFIN